MFNEDWKREFLAEQGWADAVENRAGEDWAMRKFSRLTRGNETVILMQSLLDSDPRATSGHKIADYVRLAKFLTDKGIPAPLIIAEDVERGLLLIEDFGSVSLHEMTIGRPEDSKRYYLDATKLLLRLYREIEDNEVEIPHYNDTAISKGRRRIMDWYYPSVTGNHVSGDMIEDYLSVWQMIEEKLPAPIMKFSHADYHPHNLMIDRGRIGLIDFQGAMWAPAPYDLVNLLEDARRIVPDDIRAECLDLFEKNLSQDEWQNFKSWYDVLACQFHCRVIGQAIRLAVKEDKTRLLVYVPVLAQYLKREIEKPLLSPLKIYFERIGLDFAADRKLDLSPGLYASDAF